VEKKLYTFYSRNRISDYHVHKPTDT